MCGIAASLAQFPTGSNPTLLCSGWRRRSLHRGRTTRIPVRKRRARPGAVGLAHRRLSIIDLNTGHQPLGNEDGRVQIVFNGEIYQLPGTASRSAGLWARVRTASDTEVIVHAYEQWGEDCVARLRGMFAFAIWMRGAND